MMHLPFRGTQFALAAAAGLTLPLALRAQTAPSNQTVENQVVQAPASDRHLAPHDTFYTMEYVSKTTDKGVDGFPPGTEVKLVSVNREAHTLTVTDGHSDIELPPSKLTNDMDIAAMVRAKDAAGQERVARYQAAEAAAYEKYQKEVADYTAKDFEKRTAAIRENNERLQEQAAASQTEQPAAIESGYNNNGYYNQGGYGYGSPYGYFIDARGLQGNANNVQPRATLTTPNGSNGPGAISSTQNGTQSGNARSGGATSGTSSSTSTGTTSTGGGAAGGKGR